MTFTLLGLDDIDPDWSTRWRLGAAVGTPGGMTLPVVEVFVHHTVSADTGDVVKDVTGPCNTDQANFGKLSYSWNVHRSTMSVIEIEGTHRGAHTIDGHNNSLNGVSFGFGVIGNYHSAQAVPKPTTPDDTLIELIAEAIYDRAIKPGYAAPDVPILGHRDSGFATACCGDMLYARLPDVRAHVRGLASTHPIPPPPQGDNVYLTFMLRKDETAVQAVFHSDDGIVADVRPVGAFADTIEVFVNHFGVKLKTYSGSKDITDTYGTTQKVWVVGHEVADTIGLPK